MGHFFVHARMQGQWFRWNDSRPVDQSLPGELGDCTLFLYKRVTKELQDHSKSDLRSDQDHLLKKRS